MMNEQFTGLLLDITQSRNLFDTTFVIFPLTLMLPKLPIYTSNFSHKEAFSRDSDYML